MSGVLWSRFEPHHFVRRSGLYQESRTRLAMDFSPSPQSASTTCLLIKSSSPMTSNITPTAECEYSIRFGPESMRKDGALRTQDVDVEESWRLAVSTILAPTQHPEVNVGLSTGMNDRTHVLTLMRKAQAVGGGGSASEGIYPQLPNMDCL
jgi:hypothetical protein